MQIDIAEIQVSTSAGIIIIAVCSFQVRIGGMDGIFVAYHNTAEIFGFQYLPMETMDEVLFGNTATGDAVYRLVLSAFAHALDTICQQYPDDSDVRITFVLNRECSKLTLFSESMDTEGDGHDSQKGRLHPRQPRNLCHFDLTTASQVNGYRPDSVHLDPNGNDTWTLSTTVTHVPNPALNEYLAARRYIMEKHGVVDVCDPGSAATRLGDYDRNQSNNERIMRNVSGSHSGAHSEPIIAPWTMIDDD